MSSNEINLKAVNDLIKDFNTVAVELSALINWAQNMQENGMVSTGASMSKQRLSNTRKLIRELEKKCKPARATLLAIRDSGHFDRKNAVPLHFGRSGE